MENEYNPNYLNKHNNNGYFQNSANSRQQNLTKFAETNAVMIKQFEAK